MVVRKIVEVEMVWTFDSDQCALGYCLGSGGSCDVVVVVAGVYKKTLVNGLWFHLCVNME